MNDSGIETLHYIDRHETKISANIPSPEEYEISTAIDQVIIIQREKSSIPNTCTQMLQKFGLNEDRIQTFHSSQEALGKLEELKQSNETHQNIVIIMGDTLKDDIREVEKIIKKKLPGEDEPIQEVVKYKRNFGALDSTAPIETWIRQKDNLSDLNILATIRNSRLHIDQPHWYLTKLPQALQSQGLLQKKSTEKPGETAKAA